MINANGTSPDKYGRAIYAIFSKAETISKEKPKVNLEDYTGYYSSQPWGSENYVGVWNGKLVRLNLPTDKPGSRMTMYKHIEGDTFKRIKDNGELGADVEFIRDDSGNVYKSKSHQNYSTKMKK